MSMCSRMARPRIANPFYAGSSPVIDSKFSQFLCDFKKGRENANGLA